MKKLISVLVIISMVISLCACGTETAAPAESETPTQAVPQTNEPQLTPDPFVIEEDSVIINMKRNSEIFNAPDDDGTVIFSYGCTVPVAEITGDPQASEKINEFFAMLEEEFATGNDYGNGGGIGLDHVLELALDAYDHSQQTGSPVTSYSMDRQADVRRADSRIFSITVTDTIYSGGARATTVQNAYTFDVQTGELLTLDDIISDKDMFVRFSREHIKYLTEGITGVEASAVDALDLESCWYLDSDALVFYANPYTLSDTAGGILKFDADYSTLDGMMVEAYLPFEHPSDICSVELVSDLTDGTVAILDRLAVDDTGANYALVCSGSVYDLRISQAGYAEHSNSFYPARLLWYCSRINNGAVQIQSEITDIANIMVTYRSADNIEHRCLVTKNPDDGAILLVNASDIEGLDYNRYIGTWNISEHDDAPGLVLIIGSISNDSISFSLTAENYPEYSVSSVKLTDSRASFTTDDGSMRGLLELFNGYVTVTILESGDDDLFAPYSVYDFIIG